MIIDTIIRGINKLSKLIEFEVTNLIEACKKIQEKQYTNEWLWKKPIKSKDLYAQIKVVHDLNEVSIFVVYMDLDKRIIKEDLIISTQPDERIYSKYLKGLEWIDSNTATLKY